MILLVMPCCAAWQVNSVVPLHASQPPAWGMALALVAAPNVAQQGNLKKNFLSLVELLDFCIDR